MKVVLAQKVQREVVEPVEMELREKWIIKIWQGTKKIDEKIAYTEPTNQTIAEILYYYRNKKDCKITVTKVYSLIEGAYWDEF